MLIRYTHPAATKYIANKAYSLDEIKKDLSMDMIKTLFEPVDFKWSDIEKGKTVNTVSAVTTDKK